MVSEVRRSVCRSASSGIDVANGRPANPAVSSSSLNLPTPRATKPDGTCGRLSSKRQQTQVLGSASLRIRPVNGSGGWFCACVRFAIWRVDLHAPPFAPLGAVLFCPLVFIPGAFRRDGDAAFTLFCAALCLVIFIVSYAGKCRRGSFLCVILVLALGYLLGALYESAAAANLPKHFLI